jgi:hypothetical protein
MATPARSNVEPLTPDEVRRCALKFRDAAENALTRYGPPAAFSIDCTELWWICVYALDTLKRLENVDGEISGKIVEFLSKTAGP